MKPAFLFLTLAVACLSAQGLGRVSSLGPLPGPPDQTGNSSLEGTVVDGVTREPVKKAQVMLNGRVGLTAVTDASGHFAFRQLVAGQYSLQAQSDRYPIGRFADAGRQQMVILGAAENKKDLTLSLTPGASVRGRVLDEEGNPMARCTVLAMQMTSTENGKDLANSGSSVPTDDQGEYRITVAAGKYYLMARCGQTLPLPHAFIRRGSGVDLPLLSYPPLFYPGTADPSAATRLDLPAAAVQAGIDFQMIPASGVAVRGRLRPSSFDGNPQIFLRPADPLRRRLGQQGARSNPSTGEFQIANVAPGSYDLIALANAGGQSYFAKIPLQVGTTAPAPLDVLLSAGVPVAGTLVVEGDNKPAPPVPARLQIMLSPADNQPLSGPPPRVQVKDDGSFALPSVIPGRWRVQLSGAPGYLKSLALGDQEVAGNEVEIGAAAAALRVVVSTKYVPLDVTVSPAPDASPLMGILWADSGTFQQNFGMDTRGRSTLNTPPGKYHLCVIAEGQPFAIMQNRAFRKAIESRCQTVEVTEGSSQQVQVSAIPAADLKRIADSLDE